MKRKRRYNKNPALGNDFASARRGGERGNDVARSISIPDGCVSAEPHADMCFLQSQYGRRPCPVFLFVPCSLVPSLSPSLLQMREWVVDTAKMQEVDLRTKKDATEVDHARVDAKECVGNPSGTTKNPLARTLWWVAFVPPLRRTGTKHPHQ